MVKILGAQTHTHKDTQNVNSQKLRPLSESYPTVRDEMLIAIGCTYGGALRPAARRTRGSYAATALSQRDEMRCAPTTTTTSLRSAVNIITAGSFTTGTTSRRAAQKYVNKTRTRAPATACRAMEARNLRQYSVHRAVKVGTKECARHATTTAARGFPQTTHTHKQENTRVLLAFRSVRFQENAQTERSRRQHRRP